MFKTTISPKADRVKQNIEHVHVVEREGVSLGTGALPDKWHLPNNFAACPKKGTIAIMPILREVGYFFMAFNGQWLTRMSGPLTVPFTLLALFVPSSRLKLLFSIMAIVCAAVSSFAVWVVEHRARIAAEGAIGRRDRKELQYSSEWKELSARFEKLPSEVRADWQCNRKNNTTTYEMWLFSGGQNIAVKTLCGYAGALLVKSPTVVQQLSDNAKSQSDPAWRWLFFLKENRRAFSPSGSYGQSGDGAIILQGTIGNIGSSSAMACLDCAAAEL